MKPNDSQSRAIQAPAGKALRIVAGAGTGKTSVLVERFVKLVRDGVAPDRILALTFTIKAAAEMRSRVHRAVSEQLPGSARLLARAWIMNFHQFGLRVVRDHAPAMGLDPGVDVVSGAEWERLCARVLQRVSAGDRSHLPDGLVDEDINVRSLHDTLKIALGAAITCRKNNINPIDSLKQDDHESYRRRVLLADTLRNSLRAELMSRNLIDFADMINRTIDLFERDRVVLEQYRNRFDYYLVDEFQDTNGRQARLLALLAGADYSCVTVVGDDKQSIYRWRGARVENLREFRGEVIALETNYRSVQPILDLAHQFVTRAAEFTDAPALNAHHGKGARAVDVVYPMGSDKKSTKTKRNTAALADAIATWIFTLTGDEVGGPFAANTGDAFAWEDIVVLVRSLSAAGIRDALETVFSRRGIPYAVLGRANQEESEAIDGFHAWLSLLLPSPDPRRMAAVLERAPVHANDEAIFQLLPHDRDRAPTADWLGEEFVSRITDPEMRWRVENVRAWRDDMRRRLVTDSFDAFVQRAWAQGPGPLLLAAAGVPATVVDDVAANLASITQTMCAHDDVSLPAFLDYLTAILEKSAFRENGDELVPAGRVRIMTVHQAKGLEFPAVALAGFNDSSGRKPSFMVGGDGAMYYGRDTAEEWGRHLSHAPDFEHEQDMATLEERCILYVAMTRARDALCVGSSQIEPSGMFHELVECAETTGARIIDACTVDTSVCVGTQRDATPHRAVDQTSSGSVRAAVQVIVEERERFRTACATLRARPFSGEIQRVTWPDVARFARCPLSYRLDVVDRRAPAIQGESGRHQTEDMIAGIPGADSLPPGLDAATYGTVAHAAMRFALERPDASAKEIVDVAAQASPPGWSTPQARAMVGRHIEALRASPVAKAGADACFECDFQARQGAVVVSGIFDRIERAGQQWRVIDYKFGQARRVYEEQIGVYAWALDRAGRGGGVEGTIVFIRAAGAVLHDVDTGAASKRAARVIDRLAQAASTGEFPATPGAQCRQCSWRGVCPAANEE